MTQIVRVENGQRIERDDELVIEEPLEIRLDGKPVSVTLRTPGDDFDLAAGFLFTESILKSTDDVSSIRHWGSPNIVRVSLRAGVTVDLQRLQRHFYSTSSCGVCGKTSIDAVRVQTTPLVETIAVEHEVIRALPKTLREHQKLFDVTGAIHAAGIFTAQGEMLRVREDVGRHNAVDKVIGSFFRESNARPTTRGTPQAMRTAIDDQPPVPALAESVLCVSGRASFEIVQKAIVARIPMLVAVGAPSTLAVELAQTFNLRLAGFVRDNSFNLYA